MKTRRILRWLRWPLFILLLPITMPIVLVGGLVLGTRDAWKKRENLP